MTGAPSDAELIARSTSQPERFGLVFDRHYATIHRYLERRIGIDGADDLAGDVFRIAFEQRDRFRPLYESALPWLYGLASNVLLKHWRRERRHLHALARFGGADASAASELDDVDDRLTARADRTRLLEALASLRRATATSSSSSPGKSSPTTRSPRRSTSRPGPFARGSTERAATSAN
jgi:DNA-directed RNA polymerase specialized sigma24 family protein